MKFIIIIHANSSYSYRIEIPVKSFSDILILKDPIKKMGARYDPNTRIWHLNINTRKELEQLREYLSSINYSYRIVKLTAEDVEIPTTQFLKELESSCEEDSRIKFKGNYVEIELTPSESATIPFNDLFCYEEIRYDPDIGAITKDIKCLHSFRGSTLVIPRGLLPRLIPYLEDVPQYIKTELKIPEHVKEKLRDYQVEAIQSLFDALRICGAGTLMIATGGGKTYMAGAIIRSLLDLGIVRKIFFIAHTIDLIMQARDFIKKWGISDVGIVSSFEKEYDRTVVCCTVQTLYRALITYFNANVVNGRNDVDEELKQYMDEVKLSSSEYAKLAEAYLNADLVIIDECHHVPAKTIKYVLKCNSRALRVGLSATPWRSDGKDLEIYAVVGEIVPRQVWSSELIKKGYLVPAIIVMYKRYVRLSVEVAERLNEIHFSETRAKHIKLYTTIKRYLFNEDEQRLKEIVELAKICPKPILILTKEKKPAEKIYKTVKSVVPKTELATGAVKGEERERIYNAVRNGKIDVIVATTVADEGLDLPPLRTLILTCGGSSKTRTLQRVGRVVRPYGDKKFALVIDFWDDTYYFDKQGAQRIKLYQKEPEWKILIIEDFDKLRSFIEKLRSVE